MLSAHVPSQHVTAGAAHVAVHSLVSLTHALLLAQRTGLFCGHGHEPAFVTQLLSWHMMGAVRGHSALHSARDVAQNPLSQRAGVQGGHGHFRTSEAHVPSQHFDTDAPQESLHMLMLSTHVEEPGQRAGRSMGHGHIDESDWHVPSEHLIGVGAAHTSRHLVLFAMHRPLKHLYGR